MEKEVLIMVPNPRLPGGVAHFYREARKHFSINIKYDYVSSSVQTAFLKILINAFFLCRNILKIYLIKDIILVLNPSLTRNSFWRDGILALVGIATNKKVVVFWRGWNPNNESIFNNKLPRILFKHSFLKVHRHIVLNQYIEDKLIFLGVHPEVIQKSNTIVDDSYFDNKERESTSKKILLFLTRIEKYKGIYETIEMFQQLKYDPSIELHIAGNGAELYNVKKYVEVHKIPGVRFLGYLSGKRKIDTYKRAYCYIFPSYSEGMPNSVLEAMASGLPIICTNVGAIADFFENQKMGYSFDHPVSIDDLKNACNRLIQDTSLRDQIGVFNNKYAKENFRASKTIERLEQMFYE